MLPRSPQSKTLTLGFTDGTSTDVKDVSWYQFSDNRMTAVGPDGMTHYENVRWWRTTDE